MNPLYRMSIKIGRFIFKLGEQCRIITLKNKELREQNKLLVHEKWELGQEKAQLYGQLKQLETHPWEYQNISR